MTPRYPGAEFFDVGGSGRPCSFEACSWHEAVTLGTVEDLIGFTSRARAFHLCIGEHGDCGQATDFHEAVKGTADGNHRMITVETWDGLDPDTELSPDGVFTANNRPWTPRQAERIADIVAFMDIELGIPIKAMSDTGDVGHAPHRLGVPRAGGDVKIGFGPDVWTSSPGKSCPGDLRVLQLWGPNLDGGAGSILERGRVIAAAVRSGVCGFLPTGEVDLSAALARTADPFEAVTATDWLRFFASAFV